MVLIAVISFSINVLADTSPSWSRFDKQLSERAEQYLRSVHAKAVDSFPESLGKTDQKARDVVLRGLANLNRPSRLAAKRRLAPANLEQAVRSLQKTDSLLSNRDLSAILSFLGQRFRQPTEWEVAVRVALPSRFAWEKVHGILTRHCPFGNRLLGNLAIETLHSAVIVSTSSYGTFDLSVLRASASGVFSLRIGIASVSFSQRSDILFGFPLIAQTIVLRN